MADGKETMNDSIRRMASQVVARRRASQEAQLDRAIRWLEEKWGPARTCPYCDARDWQVGTPIAVTTGDLSSSDRLGAMTPAFPVMCGNCGHTVMINAVVAGIVDEDGSLR